MKPASDCYGGVEDGPETECKIKGSRFLGRAFRVTGEEQATIRLRDVRRSHHAATHHCWALRLGLPGSVIERFDDDGEPSGTAGRPILLQLQGRALHDTLLVVTRYFGGTKLGTGGLARAYTEAAAGALDAAQERVLRIESRLVVSCEYDDLGIVEAVLARASSGVGRVMREYAPAPRLILSVSRSRVDDLIDAIVEATAGRVSVTRSGNGADSC